MGQMNASEYQAWMKSKETPELGTFNPSAGAYENHGAPIAPAPIYGGVSPTAQTNAPATGGGSMGGGIGGSSTTTSETTNTTDLSLPSSAPGAPGPTSKAMGTVESNPVDEVSPAIAGLTGAFQDVGASNDAGGGGAAGGMGNSFGSALRPNLGNRMYPIEGNALAALRRAY